MAVAKQMYGLDLTSRPNLPPVVGGSVGVLRLMHAVCLYLCKLLAQ